MKAIRLVILGFLVFGLMTAQAFAVDMETAGGAAAGAGLGAIVGGPVGAGVGAAVGGIAGATAGQEAYTDQPYGRTCQLKFSDMDTTNSGAIRYEQFEMARYGSSLKGPSPNRSGMTVFNSADVNRDNLLSMNEYCAWTNRNTIGPRG